MESERIRCDHCKKWVKYYDTCTLPEELYHLLNADNEFGICWSCACNYKLEYWKKWIPIARLRKSSLSNTP